MKELDAKEVEKEIIKEIKDIFKDFIFKSKVIPREYQYKFYEEIEGKKIQNEMHISRTPVKRTIEHSLRYFYEDWSKENHNLLQMWQKVAIENAKINNNPHLIANEVLKEVKKQFKIEKYD